MAVVTSCKCAHPKLVTNKYTGQDVFKSCGKCIPCKRARQSKWVAKMQRESNCHLYEFEIALDYDDRFLPKFDFSDCGDYLEESTPRLKKYYQKYPHLKKVYFNDLNFETNADLDYFIGRLNGHRTAIPHASVYDIQIFKKRLNTYIKRELTGRYQNFRSVFVSELGGQTLRPHYHGILWFDDKRIAKNLNSLVRKAWRSNDNVAFGHAYAKPSRGKLTSYIAKYITLPTDLPSFYEHPSLHPIFLSSRCPSIGSLFESKTEIRRIFDEASPRKIEFVKQGELWCPKVSPIGQNIENRLFPKCLSYSQISDSDKRKLYKIAIFNDDVPPYKVWLTKICWRIFSGDSFAQVRKAWPYLSVYDSFSNALALKRVGFLFDDFSFLVQRVTRNFERERSLQYLYCVSSRVWHQSKVLDVDVDTYIDKILLYHNVNKPQFTLSNFYRNQDDVLKTFSDVDIKSFYPLSYFREGVDPSKSVDSKLYVQESELKYKESLKNKEFSEYREKKLRYTDPLLFDLLENYYAQKCNENVEAPSYSW